MAGVTAAIAAIVGTVYAAWRKILKPVGHWVCWNLAIPKTVMGLKEDVTAIRNEFRANGGSSMIDIVRRNSEAIIEIRNDLGEMRWLQCRTMTGLVFVCDIEGRNLIVSQSYADMLGYSVSDLLGYGWKQIVPHDLMPEYEREWKSVFGDQRRDSIPVHLQHHDGHLIPVTIRLTPHMDASGCAVRYLGVCEVLDEDRRVIVEE